MAAAGANACRCGPQLLCAIVLLSVSGAFAEITDSTKSTATGNGLQFATAGVMAAFTVTAKDESGVRRTSGGDEFIVELEGTRSISGDVVDNLDGTYAVSYTPTKSGNYEAGVKLAKSGGLTGQYFENVWFFYTPVKTTVNPTINLDWGVGPVTDAGMDYVSIRWQGKVKPMFAETHTFFLSSDDGAKLWVDNVVMIDRWDSMCNETSATIALKPHVFYDIKLEYKEVTGTAFVRMSWATQSTPKEIVPANQLYYETHVKQSPFSFIVNPNIAVGQNCWAAGEGLVLATAGTSAQLTLQANDVYDNERGEGGDIFSVRVFPPVSGRPAHAVVVDEGDSSYVSEYTQYVAGNNTLRATLLTQGGVSATYYDGDSLVTPVKYAEGTTALQKVQFKASAPANNDFSIPTVDGFSVRWAGHIAPVQDSTYTFTWDRVAGSTVDRVRLWVDNSLLIDKWTVRPDVADPSATIDLRASYYYDLQVDYKVPSGGASLASTPVLKWSYAGLAAAEITSTNLFRGSEVRDTPTTVFVHPAGTCAAKSFTTPNQQAAGHSLELATAGLQADFTITAKDIYGNFRSVAGEKFKVRLTGVDSLAGVVEDIDAQPGSYRVLYTATKSGTYDVSVVFGASGVLSSPFRLTVQPARRHLINSPITGQALTLSTAGVMSAVTITVRDRHENWQPDPAIATAGIRFSAADADMPYESTATNQQILQTADKPYFADTTSYIGDVTLQGKQVATPTTLDNPRLIMRYVITKAGKYSLRVGGDAASHESAVKGAPFDLTIFPSPPCAVTSTAASIALSLATAGRTSVFTIQARDLYGNERGVHVGDNFVARVRQYYGTGATDNVLQADRNKECANRAAVDVACQAWQTYNSDWVTVGGRDKQGTVVDQGDGRYIVSYDVTRSGTNYLWASLAVAGGLQATYYTTTTANDYLSDSTIFGAVAAKRIVQTDTTVDFSVTSAAPRIHGTAGAPGVLLDKTWAARWTGLVLPSQTEVYTFYAGGDVTGSAKTERVKLWVDNSLIIQQWASLTTVAAPSGSIKLEKNTYYEVLLAAKTNTANTANTAKMQLKWSSFTHAASLISSSRLFVSHHVSNSPFPLYVEQSETCSAKSRVFKAGVSLATAGIVATFTIQGRDSYDNKRLFDFNEGLGREYEWAVMANASLPPAGSLLQNSVTDGGEAAYKGTVVYLNAGGYQVNYTATRSEKYNLRGRLLSSGGIFGTYFENEDLSDHATAPDGSLSYVNSFERFDPEISFDWGLSRPVGNVTSNLLSNVLDEGILLAGDIVTPFDQVTLDPNTASPIAEAYVGAKLIINGEQRDIISSSPASNVGVVVADAASTTSALKLATTASAVDDYYNGWTATVFNTDGSSESRLITDYVGSTKVATLATPVLAGEPDGKAYSVSGARVVKVSASFLSGLAAGAKYAVADTKNAKDIGPDYFSARWEGMVRAAYSELHTFSVYCDDGARLYVNDLLILDHWYSRISEVDGTIALVGGTHYPIRLEYKQVTGNASVHLRWRSRSQPKAIVPSTALYSWTTAHTLSNSNGSLYVEPAKVCASTSSAFGQGLSLATAGIPAYFSIQSRDQFLNNRKTADAGTRPGEPGTAKLVHYGTLTFVTATEVTLDTASVGAYPAGASTIEHAYKGMRLYLDGRDHHDEFRTIITYSVARKATLDAAFTSISSGSVAYKVVDVTTPNANAMAAFLDGFPEFHTHVQPLVDGGDNVLHHVPTRLSSAQFPGGLTATYYDSVTTTLASDDSVSGGSRSMNADVLSQPRWATQCSSGRPCDYSIDFSESAQFKRKQYGADCGVEWAGKVNAGVAGTPADKYHVLLDATTASNVDNAYLDHYIVFLDGICRGRWAKITEYKAGGTNYKGKLDLGADTWSDGSNACAHASGDAYEIYQGAINGGDGPISKPLFPRSCKGGTELTRGWKVYEPSENPTAAMGDSIYAVRWSGMISASAAGVYTFFADLPTAAATGAADDRVKLWIDNSVVIMHWSSLTDVNGGRTGTFSFDAHPSMHTINVAYKNVVASTSGLQLRWQSTFAGHRQAFSSAFSGLIPAALAGGVCAYAADTCRLGSVVHADGKASSQVDNLYNMQFIKFTSGGNCNGRWTRIGADADSSNAYAKATSCIKFSGTTWVDGGAGCTCAANEQFKLIEWFGFPGTVNTAQTNCPNEGHIKASTITAQVGGASTDTTVSVTTAAVTEMAIVAQKTYIRINDEIMKVTAVSGGTLTVQRGKAQTSLTVHESGVAVYALSQLSLQNVVVPSPATTFASMIILFTTGNCKGRWANITVYDSSEKCVFLGGTNLGGGNNWLDGKGACTVATGDKYIIKFGIDRNSLNADLANTSGVAGALSNELWLSTVGSLQAHTAACPLGANTVHLGTRASTKDADLDNHYIRFTSGTCIDEWARIISYEGASQCATVEWESLGTGGNAGQVLTQSTGLGAAISSPLDTVITLANNVITNLDLKAGVYVRVDSELMLITGVLTATQILVERAQEGTGALPHANGAAVFTVGMRCSYGDSYTIGVSAGGPIVPSSRLFPLAGRYETVFTPTVKGDYQVHSSLAQGAGLDATFYDDQELMEATHSRVDKNINFTVEQDEVGYQGDWPRSLESKLSDRLSFSVRWAGLLQLDDHIDDSSAQMFTFESSIAETDERVKLWVDNSLIIDRWETYDHLSATSFSATIGLQRPNYYDIKMEYKQYAGSKASAVLKWHCGIPGSACEHKGIIPSSNLFQLRAVSDSPFPPFSVQPAPTCASRSTLEGPGLSSATAGHPAGFTIQAIDEYDNDRGSGHETFVVRAVPFNTWDKMEPFATSRSSKDCFRCPHTIFGAVKDLDDSTYEAEYMGTKRGHYKVLTSLALKGGLFATYYAGGRNGLTKLFPQDGVTAFHRSGQLGDSEHDFVSPCVMRKSKAGVPLSTYECPSPGYDFSDTDVSIAGTAQAGGSGTTIKLAAGASAVNDFYNGMHIMLTAGKGMGAARVITDYVGATKIATVAELPETPDTSTKYKIVGSKAQRNSGWIKGGYAVGGNTTSIRIPASGSWSHFDVEPYSATVAAPNDGTGTVLAYSAANGPVVCTVGASTVPLGDDALGEDDAYTGRYIKFTSGTCNGRWTKIVDYSGPSSGADAVYAASTQATVVKMKLSQLQFATGVASVAIGAGAQAGTGYTAGDATVVCNAPCTGTGFTATCAGTGAVTAITVTNPGSGYSSSNLPTITCPTGTGLVATATIGPGILKGEMCVVAGTNAGECRSIASISIQATHVDVTVAVAFSANMGTDSVVKVFGNAKCASLKTPWSDDDGTGIASVVQGAGAQAGTGYTAGDAIITCNAPCTGSGFAGTCAGTGAVTGITVTNPGSGYSSSNLPTITCPGGNSDLVTTVTVGAVTCNPAAGDTYKLTGGWQVVITEGSCKGQFKRVANFEPEPAHDTHDNRYGGGGVINVDSAWDTASRTNGVGPYGERALDGETETISYNYTGCTQPDTTSQYVLIPSQKAPGSIASVDNSFGVRWAGFVNPTSATEYTFLVQMPNAAAGQERVKLWLDNKLVIDQWTSLAGCLPSATVAFAGSSNNLYDLQMQYKRLQNSALPPRIKLTWLNQGAGSEVGAGSGGPGDSKTIVSARLFTNIAVPNHNVVMYLEAAGTESRASSVSGRGLTSATAGVQASFTITSRDQYANLRDMDEDSYIVDVDGPTSRINVSPEPILATPGTYAVSHLPTESGDYTVSVQRAQPGGLASEWFNNMWLMGEAADSTISEELNFDWGSQFVTPRPRTETLTGNDYVSVRWKGFFKAELSEIYTFHAIYQDGLVMYIDGINVVDNWEGVNASSMVDVNSPDYVEPAAEARATLSATAGHMYPIIVEYREVKHNASCKLFYSSASITHTIIPSARLYHTPTHAFGSPFKLYVNPSATCGPQSQVDGAGVTAATAGMQSVFTIQARDAYANTKTKWEDTFVVRSAAADAVPADALGNHAAMPWSSLSKHGVISADVSKGRYLVRFTPTAAASVTVFSSLVVPGGVFATYYDGVAATYYNLPLKAAKIDTVSATAVESGTVNNQITVPSVSSYTVRYSGLFRPAATTLYTFTPFTTGRTDKSDRVRLWVDSKLVIDQWSSLAAALPTATFAFPTADEFYELNMHYQTTELASWGGLQATVGGASAIITSSRLFVSSHVEGSPFTVTAQPADTDFSTSIIYGEGLTIATAGVSSQFSVQVKDTFHNLRKQGGDTLEAQIASVGSGAVANAKIVDNEDGTYTGSFMPSTQGLYDLSVFMGSSVKNTQLLVEPGSICSATSYSSGEALSVATAGYTATFTIQSKDAFFNLRTVGADNFVVRLTGPQKEEHNVRAGYIGAAPASNLGRFTVSFRATQSGDFKISVQAASGNGLDVKYFRDLELQQQADEGGVSQVDLDVGDATSNSNVAVTDGFSILWSGFIKPTSAQEYTFHTKVAEADERVKLWVDDQWIVDQWTSLSSTAPTGTLWLAGNVLYDLKMQYKEVAGHSSASLLWESSSTSLALIPSTSLFRAGMPLQGSPFTATVFPARTSGTVSTGTGQGLSLATAGQPAVFTIMAKDHLGNPKTSSDDVFVVRAKFNGKHSYPTSSPFTNGGAGEQSRNRVGTVVNVGPGEYAASYIATWKRNHLSDDGWNVETDTTVASKPGSYGDTGPSGIRKKYHDVLVSQAVQGGLMATYYSSTAGSRGSEEAAWSTVRIQEPWGSPYRTKLTPVVSQEATQASDFPANICIDAEHTFAIRYSGFLSPPLAQRYTFQAKITDTATDKKERLRLWLDNVLVIDQWSSLAATTCGAGCFQGTLDFSTANTHHDLVLEYKETALASNTKAKVQLYYQTGTTSTGNKLEECKAAFSAGACAACEGTACTYDGTSVLIPSARLWQRHDLAFNVFQTGGLTATYYDNHDTGGPDESGGVVSVSVAGSGTSYTTGCTVGCMRAGCPGSGFTCACVVSSGSVTGVTVTAGGRGYSAEDPPTVTCAGGTGQSFFVNLDYAKGHVGGALSPKKAVVEPQVDWSGPSATDRPYADSVTNGQFAVRWMGFVRPSRTDEYSFYVRLHGGAATNERIRLWVDNSLIIDQFASLAATAPVGTLSFPAGDDYYPIQLDYKIVSATQANRGLRLEWENKADRLPLLYGSNATYAADAVARGPIPGDRLVQALVGSHVSRDDRHTWDTDFYDAAKTWVYEDRTKPRTSQWAKTNGCPASWGSDLRGRNLRYAECRGQGTRDNEVLRVDVRAAAVCASTSNVLGVALTISTAGITRTFTLTARDAYDNQRDATDDSFIARAVLYDGSDTRQFHGKFTHQTWETLKAQSEANPVWDQNGKYEIDYAVSRSGKFQHTIKELDLFGHGLWGSYFRGRTLDHPGELVAARLDADVAFDWGSGASPLQDVVLAAGQWSGRWIGYVRPRYSDSYTFSVAADGGTKVFVDGVSIVGNWDASSTQAEVSGTIVLTSGVWYDLQVEYVPAPAVQAKTAKLQLSWNSPQQEKELVPSERLRSTVALVGPESADGLPNGGFNILDVHPTVVCATASVIRGAGLSIATAGISASFTVWSKDMYGNLRDDTNDMLMARMLPDDAVVESGVIYGGTGLQATYYDRLGLTEPKRAASKGSVLTFINRFTLDQAQFNDGSTPTSLAKAQVWSARWMGLIRPSLAGEYTFHTDMTANTKERIKLWVDNTLIINQWESLGAVNPAGTVSFASANQLYRIKVAYKNPDTSATAKVLLKWEANGVTKEDVTINFLYPCEHPSALNSAGSSCDSDSKIQTQSIDASSSKLSFGDSASSVAFGLRRLAPTTTGLAPERAGPFSSTFAPFLGNRHPFSYVQTRAGSHTIAAHEVAYNLYDGSQPFASTVGTGLMATYYETAEFGTPRNAYDCQQGRTACGTSAVDMTTTGLDTPFSLANDGIFSVRWAGMVRAPDTTSMVTFRAKVGSSTVKDERVKVWVDNSLIIDEWTSLSATTRDSARLALTGKQLYDIKIEFKNVVAGSTDGSTMKLLWAWNTQSELIVPSTQLFSSHSISGAFKRVRVNPNVAFAPACEVHGLGLTLSTAGIQATFKIQSKDAYNNRRGVGGDLFVVRAFSDGCQTLNPGRDNKCDGFTGTTKPDGGTLSDALRNGACSDTATCAPYPPQVASNGANLLGDSIAGGSYLGEIGLAMAEPALVVAAFPSTTSARLSAGEVAVDHAYVGATITFVNGAGGACTNNNNARTIIAYNGATKVATLNAALTDDGANPNPVVVLANCEYKITNSHTVGYLGASASTVPGAYDQHRIRFTSGDCIDRWTTLKSFAGNDGAAAPVATRAMFLSASSTAWLSGTISSQTSATVFVLGTGAETTHTRYIGMWITVRTALGVSLGTSKIANYATGTVTVSPALSAATGAATYVIHGWDDGGRPCKNSGTSSLELIPPRCDRVIDAGTLAAVGSGTSMTLGASASLTADAYNGYYLSVDGTGELNKILDYSNARVVTLAAAFTDLPTGGATGNKYTVFGCTGDAAPMSCANCPRIVRADVVDNGDSTYSASFTATRKGQYTVVTSLVNAGGVVATYYDSLAVTKAQNFGEGTPKASGVSATVDWSTPSSIGDKPTPALTNGEFAVRWLGFVRPSRAQQYTFHMSMPNSGTSNHFERVKLWVDNSIIIQQWTSLQSIMPSGTIGFGRANGYYDIQALYHCNAVAKCSHSLLWESTVSGVANLDTAQGRIRSDRLFQRLDIPNMPSGLQVQPAVTCAAESVAYRVGLTIATAGVASSFTIQSKDAYENIREDTSAVFTVSIHGSGGSPYIAGAVIDDAPSTAAMHTASFTLENAKGYEVFVKHGNENLRGSPFALVVKPSNSCGSKSTIQGTGLTASALSPAKSAFTIQARDQYGNARTQANPAGKDYVVRVVRTEGTNLQGTNGLPPFYFGSTAASVSGTLHAVFNTATNDGRFAGSYQVPPTPNPANLNHYLYASYISKGSVSATYYTTTDGTALSAPANLLTDNAAANKHPAQIGGIAVTTASAAATGLWGGAGFAAGTPHFVVRWNGLYANTGQTARYFKWDGTVLTDRLRLWVDNKLIVDQWTSMDTAAAQSAAYTFDSATGLYDVHVEWYRTTGALAAATPVLKDSTDNAAFTAIPTGRLYYQEELSGSPYAVSVSC